MKSNELASSRKLLEQSQRNLANLLGTSLRSVHAYEQGWRDIPPQIERMILYLLYQKLRGQKTIDPCWEIKKCPTYWREKCPAYKFRAEGPCWFLNGTFCEGKIRNNWNEKMEACRTCSIFTHVKGSKGY
jgi:DNA-binding XRE family transcriptional regulator